MNLSPNFTIAELIHSEYAIRNGINNAPGSQTTDNLKRLAERLELVRAMLGHKPIVISSGYRCTRLNTAIGGSKSSAHLLGNAADLTCPAFGPPIEIVKTLRSRFNELAFDQLILEYPNSQSGGWVHFGLAEKPRGQVLVTHNGKDYSPL